MLDFLKRKGKEEPQIKFAVEAFKGALEKDALTSQTKMYFDEDKDLIEVVALGDLEKADGAFKKILEEKIEFEIKAKDFCTSYLITIRKGGKIGKITAIITESVSEELVKLFDEKQQVIRMAK